MRLPLCLIHGINQNLLPSRRDGMELPLFNNAKNFVSFVDGHVSYIKIYWNSAANSDGFYSMAFYYDPPAGYDYQWSGD